MRKILSLILIILLSLSILCVRSIIQFIVLWIRIEFVNKIIYHPSKFFFWMFTSQTNFLGAHLLCNFVLTIKLILKFFIKRFNLWARILQSINFGMLFKLFLVCLIKLNFSSFVQRFVINWLIKFIQDPLCFIILAYHRIWSA